MSFMRVFGCRAFVHVPKEKRRKLDEKSIECLFVGYSEESKAYRLYEKSKRKIHISRDVVFLESNQDDQVIEDEIDFVNISSSSPVSDIERIECDDEADAFEDADDSGFMPLCSGFLPLCESSNNNIEDANESAPNSVIEISSKIETTYGNIGYDEDETSLSVRAINFDEPVTVDEAMRRADADLWKSAMAEEFEALESNKTWRLVELPKDKKPIDCKWVFKIKRNTHTNAVRYKARLVVRGFSQRKGIDYDETYSPVVRHTSIRFLLAIAAKLGLRTRQLDVVTAFLNGELEEDIFMLQPKMFNDGSDRVCKLMKSLYGLKQASRAWNMKLNSVLLRCGLQRSEADSCVYYSTCNDETLILAVYVDDMLVLSNSESTETKIVSKLMTEFEMKDLGEVSTLLGVNIQRNEDGGITMDQSAYISNILVRFGMSDCNPISTPIDVNQKLSKSMCPSSESEKNEMQNVPYQEAIGCLMYVGQLTRPDICFALCLLSRFNKNPGKAHWTAVKRLIRYLKGTMNDKLRFSSDSDDLRGFCDADWAGDVDDRKSTTGYVFTMQRAAISWSAKTQRTVALSSTEAEFMAMTSAVQESIWLKRFENELVPNSSPSIELNCDNKSAIHLAANASFSPRTKHIAIRSKFIQEKVSNGSIKINYLSTEFMKADIFTKPMFALRQEKLRKEIGIVE